MNLMHLKYAVEVAKYQSINKAAEKLYMNQPNLSRAIKELEESLGITIFNRTSKGITVTPQGEEFLVYANKILCQVDEVEALYKNGRELKQEFSISVPRASYISEAFVEFAKEIELNSSYEILYNETNAVRAINNILQSDYKLGIIRYKQKFDEQFRSFLIEKGIDSEIICEFTHVALMSKNNPLAGKKEITYDDLSDFAEVAHADPYVPSLSVSEVKKDEYTKSINKRIFVFERASQFDILESVPNSFMWVSRIPKRLLDKYNLVQLPCKDDRSVYKDVLIYRKGYDFTNLDNAFISEICKVRDSCI